MKNHPFKLHITGKFCAIFVLLFTMGIGEMGAKYSKRIIFFQANDNWLASSAKPMVHYWKDGSGDYSGDLEMILSNNEKLYYAFIPDEANRVQFYRKSGDNVWNRTGDLTLENWYGQGNINNDCSFNNWSNTIWWNTYTVYYDDTETAFTSGVSTPKLRCGTTATTTKDDMILVTGTQSLYKHTKSGGDWGAYHAFCIANAAGATGAYSIYNRGEEQYLITKQTEYIRGSLMGNFTIIGRSANSHQGTGTDASCRFYPTDIYYGILKYTITNTSVDHATVELYYWDENNEMQTVAEGSSAEVLPSTKVWCKVTPDAGYAVTTVMLSDPTEREWTDASNDASGRNLYVVRTNVSFRAVIEPYATKTILVKDINSWAPNMYFKGWNPFLYEGYDNNNYHITTQKVADKVNVCGDDYYIITFTNEFPFYYMHNEGEGTRTAFFTPSRLTHMQKYNNTTEGDGNWGLQTTDCTGAIYWIETSKDGKKYISNVVASTEDILSFYAASGSTIEFHVGGSSPIDVYSTIAPFFNSGQALDGKAGGVFTAKTDGSTLTDVAVFDGDYHIHVNAETRNYLNAGGVSKTGTTGTLFTKFDKSTIFGDTYDHYWVDWFLGSGDGKGAQSVIATVGNKYNANLAGILGADEFAPKGMTQDAGGNVRYAYNPETNYFARAIVSAAGDQIKIAGLTVSDSIKVYNGSVYENATPSDKKSFSDATYWNYQVTAKVRGTSHANITTTYGDGTQTLATKKVIGGKKDTQYDLMVNYDFKTNRLVAAWTPPNGAFDGFDLQSNLILERQEDGASHILNTRSEKDMTNVSQVYTVMKFTKENWDAPTRTITGGGYTDAYYWISLPYDCNVSDIFGIEGYGNYWVIQTYMGSLRAEKGWWAEYSSWWYNLERTDTLKANEGYVIRLTNLESSGAPFTKDGVNTLRLYFPSSRTDLTIGQIGSTTQTLVKEHICEQWHGRDSIEGHKHEGDPRYDRRAIDSNWNIIGSPSFNKAKITDGDWGTEYPTSNITGTLKYFYTWAANTNPRYKITSANDFEFKATHAYLVQYAGTINWAPYTDNSTDPLVGIKASAPKKENDEQSDDQTLKMVLKRGEEQVDVTYISRMAEGATDGYDLNLDLSKLLSTSGNNLYTIAGYYKMAGNCLPDTVTYVPVGVQLATSGEYTFSMPDGTNGTGTVLVDNTAGTRTNLALTDYTVNLEKGTYDNRFALELSQSPQTPTSIETPEQKNNGMCKKLIDGILYIVRDGKVYDAQGIKIK